MKDDGAKADTTEANSIMAEADKIEDDGSDRSTERKLMGSQNEEEVLKGDRVIQDSTEEHSFEILSPSESKKIDEESSGLRALPNKTEKDEDTNGTGNSLLSSLSSRSSPAKEDSSSNSSLEVVQSAADNTDRLVNRPVANPVAENNGDRLHSRGLEEARADHSETASTGSWISVDDEIRVRKSKHEKFISDKGSDVDLTKSPGIFLYTFFSLEPLFYLFSLVLYRQRSASIISSRNWR